VSKKSKKDQELNSLERMDEALKAALKMPPRKHKDEPKRTSRSGVRPDRETDHKSKDN